jgi:hypothetical protein
MRFSSSPTTLALMFAASALPACANDPEYINSPMQIEATGMELDKDGAEIGVKGSLVIPFETESADDAKTRAALAAKLMVDVPYVKVGDVAVSIEWTIKNLDPMNDGLAVIQLNGANEFFVYDPLKVILSAPNDDEAPKTPGLIDGAPIHVAAGAEVSGVIREDEIEEASVDLDMVTRGNISPFAAVLSIDRNRTDFQPLTAPMPADPDYMQTPTGPDVPRAAFANLVRVDLVFKPDHHMVLEYSVRVRDTRGILAPKLLDAPASDLQPFMPMDYVPVAPTVPPAS